MPNVTQLAIGLALSLLIATIAYRAHSLSSSGAAGAIIVGTVIFGLGGWTWGLLLIAFFISSSALSHYKAGLKADLGEKFAKTGRRDVAQVLANGGWGTILTILAFLLPDHWLFFAAFVGAMAAVNADTWATELGVLSPRLPRLITTGRVVATGTSGAVSLVGWVAAASGALFIGLVAAVLMALEGELTRQQLATLPMLTLVSGLSGSLVDSILGATVQGIYWCVRDGKETEKRVHTCGEPTLLIRGWAWLNNDWVNFICSVVGSLIAILVWTIVG